MNQPQNSVRFRSEAGWYFVSAVLLVVYLVFFHILNASDPASFARTGVLFTTIWMAICFVFQSVFRNRFELGMHMLVAIDFGLESLVPEHVGYGFYICAAAFWTVFLFYHHWPAINRSLTRSKLSQPEISDPLQ